MRILVVDDSAFMRRALTRLIQSEADLTVVGTARDGDEAVEQVRRLRPDLVTLDMNQPRMNGLDALRRIMRECPTPVIMVSSLTRRGSDEALEALRLGALDFVAKDASFVSLDIHSIRDELIAKIRAVGRSGSGSVNPGLNLPRHHGDTDPPRFEPGQFDVIVIGASTGGPPVIETIASSLPADFPIPIVVAQHMPAIFTCSFAQRLDGKCAITVMEAQDGMPLRAGVMYIAPGERNTRMQCGRTCRYSLRIESGVEGEGHRPSVDALFSSSAEAAGAQTLGVILTGMGDDGARGAAEIRNRGGFVMTQSAGTCVVYGMPRAVEEEGASLARLSPLQMCAVLAPLARPAAPMAHADLRRAG